VKVLRARSPQFVDPVGFEKMPPWRAIPQDSPGLIGSTSAGERAGRSPLLAWRHCRETREPPTSRCRGPKAESDHTELGASASASAVSLENGGAETSVEPADVHTQRTVDCLCPLPGTGSGEGERAAPQAGPEPSAREIASTSSSRPKGLAIHPSIPTSVAWTSTSGRASAVIAIIFSGGAAGSRTARMI